jgi:hypothetical protein
VHSLEVPLQLPNGQENPVATEPGHPPSGQATAASASGSVPPSSETHMPSMHVWPLAQAAPQPPQLALSTA